MIPRQLVLALLLLTVTGLAWWLADPTPITKPTTRTIPHTPDYSIKRFTATSMSLDGKPRHALAATRMDHYPDDDTTELTAPRLTVYDDDLPPWRIDAERGCVSGDGELVLLKGRVKVLRDRGVGARPVEINTTNLRVQPSANFAETEDPIQIRSGNSWVNATGMKVWFIGSVRMQLLNEVKGQYEVN